MHGNWTSKHTLSLIALTVVIGALGSATSSAATATPWTWYGILVLLTLFIVVAGHGAVGRLAGALIDPRNKMTLSRLQLLIWTVLILSAYLTVAIARVREHGVQALDISMPPELWWLMGISTASMVGSPLILSGKKAAAPAKNDQTIFSLKLLAAADGVEPKALETQVSKVGSVLLNNTPARARMADLFRGDETGNAGYLDLGKVQMFFFTLVIALAYFFTLKGNFSSLLGPEPTFPAVSESMVALLGISHAGYLSLKAVPQGGQVNLPR